MPLLAKQLFNTYLRDFEGVSAYLTAIAKTKQDLEQGGFPIPDVIISGAILNGLGDQYTTTQELIQTLPSAQQTSDYISARILEAEKNDRQRRQVG